MKTKMYYKMTLVAVFLLTSCLLSAPVLIAGTITDNFNDNSMNTNLWQVDKNGLPTVNEVNAEVGVSIPANIQGESWAGYVSRFALRGNFDMQVEYSLLPPWPTNSGVEVELFFGPNVAFSNREDYISQRGEVYSAFINASINLVSTGDTSGTLKIARTGNTIDCYYMGTLDWVKILSLTDQSLAEDGTFGFTAGGWPPNFGGQSVQVAFDNFQLQYDQIVPIPSSILLLGGGLLGLGLPGLRRRIKRS